MKPHTFVVIVEDLPGVLNRISSMFRRRDGVDGADFVMSEDARAGC